MSCGSLPTGDEFAVVCERTREHLVLELFGKLDLATAPALEQQLETVSTRRSYKEAHERND
jgi:anti-anti-sigma regulatory factor